MAQHNSKSNSKPPLLAKAPAFPSRREAKGKKIGKEKIKKKENHHLHFPDKRNLKKQRTKRKQEKSKPSISTIYNGVAPAPPDALPLPGEVALPLLLDPPHPDAAALRQHPRAPPHPRPALPDLPEDGLEILRAVPEAPGGGGPDQLPEVVVLPAAAVVEAGRPDAEAPGEGGVLPAGACHVAVADGGGAAEEAADVEVAGPAQGPVRCREEVAEWGGLRVGSGSSGGGGGGASHREAAVMGSCLFGGLV